MTKSTRELIPNILVLPVTGQYCWLTDCPLWIERYQSAITHQEPKESPTLALFGDAKWCKTQAPAPTTVGIRLLVMTPNAKFTKCFSFVSVHSPTIRDKRRRCSAEDKETDTPHPCWDANSTSCEPADLRRWHPLPRPLWRWKDTWRAHLSQRHVTQWLLVLRSSQLYG